LVPPRDPGSLAAAVNRILDEPDLAARLREEGPRRAMSFDWSATLDRIEALYRRAIDRGAPSLR
jgi:glycosyltransferase involved in cell wall biosynthesis